MFPNAIAFSSDSEIWRPIPRYAGIYEASSLGRIRSLDHVDRLNRLHRGRVLVNARMQKHRTSKGGNYLRIRLRDAGRTIDRAVHQLVLEAFIGLRPTGMDGCHTDDDPLNNRIDNLRWDTPTGNQRDKIRNGTIANGERNGSARLTEEQVRSIWTSSASGAEIARQLAVNAETVRCIRRGQKWAHLTSMWEPQPQRRRKKPEHLKPTHCPHGHPYSGANLHEQRRGTYFVRICRECRRSRDRHYYAVTYTGRNGGNVPPVEA